MPVRRRVGIAALFLVSCIADAISVARIYFATRQQTTLDTWDLYWLGISGIIEIGIGQVCVSIPVIQRLVVRYSDYVKSWTRVSSKRLNSYRGRKYAINSHPASSNESSERLPAAFEAEKQFGEHSDFGGVATIKRLSPLPEEVVGIGVVHTADLDNMCTQWVPLHTPRASLRSATM